MPHYKNTAGRFTVEVGENGAKDHTYGYGCKVSYVNGWNSSCDVFHLNASVEELHDLRYLLDRAIATAGGRT
jgi:hypothetical protein